jgi:ATP-dependent RNA helicase DDX41
VTLHVLFGVDVQTARAKKDAPPESATDKVLAEEADMMRHITQKQALRAAKELATDTVYTRSMSTGWKPPTEARESWQLAATEPSALCQ